MLTFFFNQDVVQDLGIVSLVPMESDKVTVNEFKVSFTLAS
jgi:hypothetical protein